MKSCDTVVAALVNVILLYLSSIGDAAVGLLLGVGIDSLVAALWIVYIVQHSYLCYVVCRL